MYAMLGVGLLAVAALVFAWAYGQFLRPRPRAWTRGDLAAVTVTLTVVCLSVFAVALLGTFLFNLASETRWLEIAAVTGGALVVCWFLVPRLAAPALQTAKAQAAVRALATDKLPDPANDPHPTSPARPGRPSGKPDRHRAA